MTDLRDLVGAYLLAARWNRRIDLEGMVRWAIANGLLHRISSGPYEGRYVIGPGHWPVLKKYNRKGRMLTRLPSRKQPGFYLLPGPGHRDVRVRFFWMTPAPVVHLIASRIPCPTIPGPRHLYLEYSPVLPRGYILKLAYHFPSSEQLKEFRRLWALEQAVRYSIEPGLCPHVVRRVVVSDEHPRGKPTLVPCSQPVVPGTDYCAQHQSWAEVVQRNFLSL